MKVLDREMKSRTINTIQDVRYMVEPVAGNQTKPSLLAKTSAAIDSFFGASSQSNRNEPMYLTGTQSHTIPASDAWGKAGRPGLH